MLLRDLTEEEKKQYSEKDEKGYYLWDNLRRRGGNSRPTDRPKQWFPLYVDKNKKVISVEPIDNGEEMWPIDPKGEKRIWRVNKDGAKREISAGEISVIEKAGRSEIVKKTRMPNGKKPKTLWKESAHSATTHGTKLLIDILGIQSFTYPKSINLVKDCIRYWADENAVIMDYFAGSGTTGHAINELNREDDGLRKYILVEMGKHCEDVLLPRISKTIYSKEWKYGKPVARDGISHMFKYMRLESYEDALNNLDVSRTEAQQSLLDMKEAKGANGLKEQYMLRYMLDVETRGSQSLLNLQSFIDPTAYKLKVKHPGSDESSEMNVDLLETFNWLIGLTVKQIAAPQVLNADFERDSEKRLHLKGRLKQEKEGKWWFRTVSGSTPDGRKTLIIWRKRPGGESTEGIEQDNLVLDEWFQKQGYSSKDSEFDLIYVNGDNNLENLKAPDDTWKVRLIEEDFHRLMFDTEGA